MNALWTYLTPRERAEIRRHLRSLAGGTPLLYWTLDRRPMLGPGKPVDFDKHRFLVDIYKDAAQRLAIYKASQMGASEYLVSYALHAADERNATVLYIFPTDTHVRDFSTARLGPAVEASAYLARITGSKGRRGADRVTLKRVGDRFVYLRGAKVKPNGQAPQLKSVDADVIILDEVDEMDDRAPAIAQKRLGHSMIAEERWVSTPTYTGRGIHAVWLETDRREWFVPCPHCGERQPLTIHQVVEEWDDLGRPVVWHGQEEDRAWIACRRCGGELNRLAEGEWMPAYPARPFHGYHLTKLFSPTTSLLEVVLALDTVDETERKEAFNQDLGEPYTPRGGQLTDEELDACRRAYAHGPDLAERTFMGVDVGKLLNVVIRGPRGRETGERPQRFAGEVGWDDLGRLMKRYRVKLCVIDALPETTKAREFQDEFPGKVWLAYYVTQKTGTKREAPIQVDEKEVVVNLDRTRTIDDMVGGILDQALTLPADARDVPAYYAQMKAPVRVLEDGPQGNQVALYVESGPDHYFHAENYCHVAASLPAPPPLPSQKGLEMQQSQWE